MSRLLVESTMLSGLKFASASDTAKLLHFLALCYAADNLTDGFIPESAARKLTKARTRDFEKAIEHLTTVHPGCTSPSWEQPEPDQREPNRVWFLHDYDDPLYDNPLKAHLDKRREQKSKAGTEGGRKSAEARRAKYGTAQPVSSAPEADPEAAAKQHTAGGSEGASGQKASKRPTSPEAGPKLARAGAYAQPFPTLPLPTSPSSSSNAPPSPSVSTATLRDAIQNGHAEDLSLQYAVRVAELLGRDLAPLEVGMCTVFLDDFAYLSVDDMLKRMHDHLEHCKAAKLPTPRKLHGFRETLRLENEHHADARAPKAWRPDPVLGDLSKLATLDQDPDQ